MFLAFLTLFDATLEEKGALLPKFKSFLSKIFPTVNCNSEKPVNFIAEIQDYLNITHAGLSEEIFFMETHYFNDDCNYDFQRVLLKRINGRDNLLVKHLAAKLTCLKVYCSNVEILLEALESSDAQNLTISRRFTDYLKIFKPDTKEEKQTKDLMTEAEVNELSKLFFVVISLI